MHVSGSAIAHCPTSNFFLGSGYLDIFRAMKKERPVRVGLGTDLGAGTSFSIMATLNEAYKAAQLNGQALSAGHAFYLATRGTARAMYLEDKIGSLAPGMEADVVVLDLKSTPIIKYRMGFCQDLEEALFIQMTMGDDRAVLATCWRANWPTAGVRRATFSREPLGDPLNGSGSTGLRARRGRGGLGLRPVPKGFFFHVILQVVGQLIRVFPLGVIWTAFCCHFTACSKSPASA